MAYGNPGVNPYWLGPAARISWSYGNPGVNPAYNGPARRQVLARKKKKTSASDSVSILPAFSFMTTEEMVAAAERMAQAEMDARQAYLDKQRAQIAADMQAAYNKQIGVGLALAEWTKNQNFPGQIQGLFGGLASDQSTLAQGYAGAAREAAQADAAEIARQNAGLGVDAGVRNEATNIGDVTYGLGGALPATTFNTQGTNYAAAAANLPGYAVQVGQFNAEQARAEESKRMDELFSSIEELAASRPALVNEMMDRLQQTQSNQYSMYSNEREWKRTLKNDAFQRMDANRRYILDKKGQEADDYNARVATEVQQGYLMLERAKTPVELAEAYTKITAQVWLPDGKGNIYNTHQPAPGYKRDKNGNLVPITGAAATAAAKAAEKAAAAKAKKIADRKAAVKARENEKTNVKNNVYADATAMMPEFGDVTPQDIARMKKELFAKYIGDLRRHAAKSGQKSMESWLRTVVNNAVNSAVAAHRRKQPR